jgi:fumarylacetoacetase
MPLYELNETHDPGLTSWIPSANRGDTDFPIQNLPFGVFRRAGSDEGARVGVAIGDMILDVRAAREAGAFTGIALDAALLCDGPSLNALMSLGPTSWSALRLQLSRLLREDALDGPLSSLLADEMNRHALLVPIDAAELCLPAETGDYTDFYASIHHATNVGSMFRPEQPLLPNYKWVPIGYHGRASSLVASGSAVRRPNGQRKGPNDEQPHFGPSRSLDWECEVGMFVGPGNALGAPVAIADAERHLFGLCLVNDWSARDLQTWEYQPLGPFLAKSFATTVSPWVVTLEALEPFRAPAFSRNGGDPRPLPYLRSEENERRGGVDITLETLLRTPGMRERGDAPARISRASFTSMYWTPAQLLAHHASNGCNLRPGDLLASGTVSGPDLGSRGCLLELTWRGAEPLRLPHGETRTFLEDGDEVIMRGFCERDDARRIGFGECRGMVLPAASLGAYGEVAAAAAAGAEGAR